MSNLLSLLSLGSNAITANNAGVGVATNNVANIETDGYSRQRVDFRSNPGAPDIGGVRSLRPDRMDDQLLSGRIRTSSGALGLSSAYRSALMDLQSRIAGEGSTIDEQLGSFFGTATELAASPTDPQLRNTLVVASRDLAIAIRRRAAAVEEVRQQTDLRIRESTVSVTDLARQLAEANRNAAATSDPQALDERDRIAKELAAKVGGSATLDAKGQLRFTLDGGAVLVDGGRAASLEASPDPATGRNRLVVVDGTSRRDVTADITGGKIGGDLKFRDGIAAQTAQALDQFAFDLASSVNAVHRAHQGADGVSGRDLFVQPTGVAGAAAAFAIDPTIDADPSKLATAAIGSGAGDATGAVALSRLRDSTVAGGGTNTLGEAALDFVADVGFAASGATHDEDRDQLIGDHLAGLRDSLAGVDIDEELANLSRFQHATGALTKFVSTIDDMLSDLIARL